jgi:hypothetical protein
LFFASTTCPAALAEEVAEAKTIHNSVAYGMSAVFERKSGTNSTRRSFLRTFGAASIAAASVRPVFVAGAQSVPGTQLRRFPLVQIDVFTSKRLQRNPLSVFTDARGLSDSEMQDLARETIQCGPVIFSNPEVMSSSVGLVPTNALVLIEPINSGMVGNRSGEVGAVGGGISRG